MDKEEQVSIESPKIGICKRCGRKLRTIEAIELGMGKVCYKKFMSESWLKPLFKMKGDTK